MKKSEFLKIFQNKYVDFSFILLAGFFLGWLVFHTSGKTAETHDHSYELVTSTIWTCAMHPQIRMDQAGKCPICGMDLIPLAKSGKSSTHPDAVHLTKEAAQLANVMTSSVGRKKPVKEVRLYGKVQADERLSQSQVAHVPGRLEKLYINFTGESVKSGQLLAQIYSPELISAQQELIEAARTKLPQPAIYESAKEKLRQYKLTGDQIENVEKSGRVESTINVISNSNGIVTSKLVNTGDYVSQGTTLFRIADLSRVWILFDAYESDLQYISKNEKVTFTLQAFPGTEFSGNIVFIDPVIDPLTRVAKVRIEAENKSGNIKPGMFANGIVNAVLTGYSDNPVIPKTAVLWTGKRSVVYVKEPGSEDPVFKMREISLGPMLGDSYIVTGGLTEGEEIVTMGTFNVDAAAQLEGKPSMMNPSSGNTSESKAENPERIEVSQEFKMQLNVVYDKYILLKNALILSDFDKSKQAAEGVQIALSNVDPELLKGEVRLEWMRISVSLGSRIDKIRSSLQLDHVRAGFSGFSDDLYKATKTFGLTGKTVYFQFCPMAEEGKGAYWLSETREILNPYFGDSMLTCGETKETLKF